ncbi:Arachidonate 5-lipoxygenase [Holothuria leucospilota]|uniref:Arachidonate 5-lipoxygenase n=1 Tax=Holothuria leucospilota TaxID=206669 RepID=A0A9Q1H2W8_HOLLE|nr:Arachidonate 5-lipoxygenase [Holothuria leucospilota]
MGNFSGFLKGRSSGYSRSTDIVVKVKTGDKRGAGTDANVKINLINEYGVISADFLPNVFWRDDFESGSIDDFEVKNLSDFGHVIAISRIMEGYSRVNGRLTFWKPYGYDGWKSDESFGQQRLNCCNPTQIRRCRKISENLAVTEAMLWPFLEGLSIQEAVDARILYYIDYKILGNLPCPDNRVVSSPIALFFVNRQRKLIPVAIQLFQKPAKDNPVFLPSDDENVWPLAKMWFNNADATYHQSCTHLAHTHLLMEPIAVATHRSLSLSHPMYPVFPVKGVG